MNANVLCDVEETGFSYLFVFVVFFLSVVIPVNLGWRKCSFFLQLCVRVSQICSAS